ncbi:MAG: beta-hexosaminidase [Ruminococcaceae bacterium]|nr:beta-hexosaminidase [Oscillospiraceae bacterium]
MNRKLRIVCMFILLSILLSVFPFGAYARQRSEDNQVEQLLASMSTREKITQMMMLSIQRWATSGSSANAVAFTEMNSQVRKMLKEYRFGAVILFAGNVVDTKQTLALTKALQSAATWHGGIPLMISIDQEGGSVYRLGQGTALPGNMALAATGDIAYAQTVGGILGSELSSLGINTNLAPVVDVNSNPNNPIIGLRSFGDDAEMVGEFASAVIKGMAQYNVLGCVKHFPGHGDTETDSHYRMPIVDKSKEELLENELRPFSVAIENGIEMIMTSHIFFPQLDDGTAFSQKTGNEESLPATLSQKIVTGLLKEELGFEGVVISDAMNMAGITDKWDSVQAIVLAVNAGVDMICMPYEISCPYDLQRFDAILDGVEEAVNDGTIRVERIDDAVRSILTLKEKRGILDYDSAEYTLKRALSTVGSDRNRSLEREIAAAAVTVVKNKNDILPLRLEENANVLMLCPYNNECALMLMGWNRAKKAGLIPDSANVDYYRYNGEELTDELKSKIDAADILFVITEVSGAERMGYTHWLSAAPNHITEYAAQNQKKSIILSADKPYDVQLYPYADAILAIYGCKGTTLDPKWVLERGLSEYDAAYGPNIPAGIEVAFGVFGATGTLPLDIPVFEDGRFSKTDLIYKRGYGITYDAIHYHSYDDKYSRDHLSHWHECTQTDCPDRENSILDAAAHVYRDGCCEVCGYKLTEKKSTHGWVNPVAAIGAVTLFGAYKFASCILKKKQRS